MKFLKYLFLTAVLLASNAYGQEGDFIRANCTDITAPVENKTWCKNQADGKFYVYQGGTWVDLSSIGGGGGTVTSVGVTGTANQITVTGTSPITTTGSLALSIPTDPTLPGNTTGTFIGNVTGNVTGNVVGNASGTATALASNPTDCVAGAYAKDIAASGNLGCDILIVSAAVDPTEDDDTGDGYIIGTTWINTTDGKIFKAEDVTITAAVWLQIYPAVEADTPQTTFGRIANGDVAVSGVTETKPWKYRGAGGGATYGFDIRVNSLNVPEFLPVCAGVVNDCDRVYNIPTGKKYEFQINSVPFLTVNTNGETTMFVPVVATASLPAAGAAMDGRIIIEDGGTGDGNLILYMGGERFRIDGGVNF